MAPSPTNGFKWWILTFVLISVCQNTLSVNGLCTDDQFRCDNSECVSTNYECDGDNDCGDYSDERNCSCGEQEFTCNNGHCVQNSAVCDTDNDCGDRSDEQNCSNGTCSEGFLCGSSECFRSSYRCNGDEDCGDGSDELDCEDYDPRCDDDQFKCDNNRCIPGEFKCDGDNDCGDNSDESNCTSICESDQFNCTNGGCVPIDYRCDNDDDCGDRSDEENCDNSGCSATSKCALLQRCPKFRNYLRRPINTRKLLILKKLDCGTRNSTRIKICCPISSLLQYGESLLPSACGRPLTNREFLGAGKSTLGSHPWMAMVGAIYSPPLERSERTDIDFYCAGTLLSNRYVLTSAGCISFYNELSNTRYDVFVRLGEYDTSKDIDCETYRGRILCSNKPIDILVEKVISHPLYNDDHNNNIGLLRLKESVLFSPFIQPICLPYSGESIEHFLKHQRPIVTGWGVTDDGQLSNMLLQLPKPYVPYQQCLKVRRDINPLSNMCLGGEFGKDICFGDGGGPAIIKRNPDSNQFVQIGIISFNRYMEQCAQKRVPSLYTNVTHFRDWIITQLRP